MADNFNATAGSGLTFAAEDVGSGVLVQRVKPQHSASGTAADISSSAPLPVAEVNGYVWVGTDLKPIKYAKADVSASSTDSSLVTAVSGKKIRVIGYQLMVGGTATSVTFNTKPAGSGTAISMAHQCAANAGISAALKDGLFETSSGEGLTVTTGSGSTAGIQVQYVEI